MIDFTQTSNACVKCGKCIPYCTIYRLKREEVTSPRGYLDLIGAYKRGELPLQKDFKNMLESCFLCTTCVDLCPSHLPIDSAIEKIRIDIAQKYGIAWYKRLYFFLLKHRKLMDFVFSFAYFVAPCAFKKVDGGNKIFFSKRVVFPFVKKSFLQKYRGEILPNHRNENLQKEQNLAQNPAHKVGDNLAQGYKNLTQSHEQKPAQNLAHNKVAIFIGCLANYNYIEVGESLLKILGHLGIKVLVPTQECCGAPAYFTGDIGTVLHLIKRNIELFEKFIDEVDAILIPEATCAAMLMVDWAHALNAEPNANERERWQKRLANLTPKMSMASKWLQTHTNLESILHKNPASSLKSLTYHDPCHAKKVLKVHKEPRALLSANYEIREMSEPDRCCGFGGVSMQLDRYALTLQAGKPKAEMIAQSGAKIISAECSACRMQITNAMSQSNVKASFAHPLELIAQNLD